MVDVEIQSRFCNDVTVFVWDPESWIPGMWWENEEGGDTRSIK